MLNRLRGLSVFVLCLALIPLSASAQSAIRTTLTPPQSGAFPEIETYLDVRDEQGKFMHGLQASGLSILEDGRSLPVSTVEEIRPGAQVVVAITPGPAFAVRNSQGISRFEFISAALENWAKSRRGSTLDDLSLVVTGSGGVTHVSDVMAWLKALQAVTLDDREATPSLDTLFQAVNLASDSPARPGMGRAVLFITPPIEGAAASLSLQNITAQALQENIHVSVWAVVPRGAPVTSGTQALMDLAEKTGGIFASISGEEQIGSPEAFIDPLRSIYKLVYSSRIDSGGAHTLAVTVQTPSGSIKTADQNFDLDIQPPDPTFISPALEIKREPPPGLSKGEAALKEQAASFLPKEQPLQVLVDFPDGHNRPLKSTTLYVDGQAVAQNTQPPFDRFDWDLSGYTSSGEHMLQVTAQDTQGLTGSSMETMIKVTLERPQANTWDALSLHKPVVAGLMVVMAGAILALVLILRGRLQPYPQRLHRRWRGKPNPAPQPGPVQAEPAAHHLPHWINRLQWPQRQVAPKAYAFFTPVSNGNNTTLHSPIPITVDELTMGSDPDQATLVLDDSSIDSLHARLVRTEDGNFRLVDEGSVAGTWINYTPVTQEGSHLEHGDLVHFGRISYRFTLHNPKRLRKPVITPDQSEEPQA